MPLSFLENSPFSTASSVNITGVENNGNIYSSVSGGGHGIFTVDTFRNSTNVVIDSVTNNGDMIYNGSGTISGCSLFLFHQCLEQHQSRPRFVHGNQSTKLWHKRRPACGQRKLKQRLFLQLFLQQHHWRHHRCHHQCRVCVQFWRHQKLTRQHGFFQ